MKRLLLLSHIAGAGAFTILAGCALYLFGVPMAYYLSFLLGIAIGAIGLLSYLIWFLSKICSATPYVYPEPNETQVKEEVKQTEERDESCEQLSESIVCQLLPQPERYDEINSHQCEYVVWRNIGETSYLTELDTESGNALFSNSPEQGLRFNRVLEAAKAANACYLLYRCQYKFFVEVVEPSEIKQDAEVV